MSTDLFRNFRTFRTGIISTMQRSTASAFSRLLVLPLALVAACSEPSPVVEADAESTPAANVPSEPAAQPATQMSAAEVEQLRSLGYVHVVEEEDDSGFEGVSLIDEARMQPGLTYYTQAQGCSSHLVDEQGHEVARWEHKPCEVWGNSLLRPNGEVIAVFQGEHDPKSSQEDLDARRLLKFDAKGNLLWSKVLPTHHDVDVMPDGTIAALTYRHRVMPEIHPTLPVREHLVTELSPDGEVLREMSLVEMMLAAGDSLPTQTVKPRSRDDLKEIDWAHSNAIEFLRVPALVGKDPLYSPRNVLFCLRHQDMIFIANWDTKEILWSWGPGQMSGPHDATMLENGNVLVFDNGLSRKWSRILEVDPRTNQIVWQYRSPNRTDFFSVTRGASSRLENGNTLITYSRTGSIFEVTPEGEKVWEFHAPKAEGKAKSLIVRARRVPRLADGELYPITD